MELIKPNKIKNAMEIVSYQHKQFFSFSFQYCDPVGKDV